MNVAMNNPSMPILKFLFLLLRLTFAIGISIEAAAQRFDKIFDKEALRVILNTEPPEYRQGRANWT